MRCLLPEWGLCIYKLAQRTGVIRLLHPICNKGVLEFENALIAVLYHFILELKRGADGCSVAVAAVIRHQRTIIDIQV